MIGDENPSAACCSYVPGCLLGQLQEFATEPVALTFSPRGLQVPRMIQDLVLFALFAGGGSLVLSGDDLTGR